jgi:hypothetical protein
MFDGWWCVDEAPESMPKMGDDIQQNPFGSLSAGFGGESETVKGTLLVSQYYYPQMENGGNIFCCA